jgi:hypothetical protein
MRSLQAFALALLATKRFAIAGLLAPGITFGGAKAARADPIGFVYSGGVFTTINPTGGPNGYGALPTGINDSGQIVGTVFPEPGFTYIPLLHDGGIARTFGERGFVYSQGVSLPINIPGADDIWPTGINDSGQIVGTYDTAGPVSNHNYIPAPYSFLDTGGVITTVEGVSFTGINDSGQIVGNFFSCCIPGYQGPGYQGFLDTGGVFTTINPPTYRGDVFPTGINDSGQVVGFFVNDTVDYGFEYTGGVFTMITPPGTYGATGIESVLPTGINDSGQIVSIRS